MAALTTNVASPAAITVSGNTQKSTTISWTLPTLPNDVTIDSCVLTGRATASMSKGSATIKVNGTTVSSGSNFTINLGTGNNTSSVTATAQGGNKNASGTVTFSNLVYTVNYTGALPKYTVTFLDYDGTVLKTEQVEQGRSATPPADPGRPGYKFTGWDGSYTNVQGDLTITAQYIEAVTYMVRFLDGITYEELKVQYVDAGGSATPPALPTREDSTSTGWSGTYTNVTSDVTILSTYRNKTYTVNFYDYDGNLIRYNTAYHGYSTVPPEAPEKEGYVFIGWDKDLSKITTNLNVNALYEQTNQVLQLKDGGTWKNSLLYKKQMEIGFCKLMIKFQKYLLLILNIQENPFKKIQLFFMRMELLLYLQIAELIHSMVWQQEFIMIVISLYIKVPLWFLGNQILFQ